NTVVIEAGDGNIITTAIGDNNTIVVDPAQALPHDAADQSRLEEFYERMWEERAAEDPLGRSAAELRAAWEAREPVPLEEALPGETTLGYSDAPRQGSTIRFEIFVPDSMLQPSGATR
ncbi:MAG: hypothetical protein KF680_06355, partial [Cryobacterium sp.]|nr:hypothetical protein [Cryobacterium sp.]